MPCARRSLVTAAAAVCLLATSPPAIASLGLERVTEYGTMSDVGIHVLMAECPRGKYVVGGGGVSTNPGGEIPPQARLTELSPLHQPSATDSYLVVAETPNNARQPHEWRLVAYAVCANAGALSHYQIVRHTGPVSTAKFQQTAAVCPATTAAFGTGAEVDYVREDGSRTGHLGLQLTRTSSDLGISRASGRADATYGFEWYVVSTAICARPVGDIEPHGAFGLAEANVWCPTAFVVVGPGGGGSLVDGGPVWVRRLVSALDDTVHVQMTGILAPAAGAMMAAATCVRASA